MLKWSDQVAPHQGFVPLKGNVCSHGFARSASVAGQAGVQLGAGFDKIGWRPRLNILDDVCRVDEIFQQIKPLGATGNRVSNERTLTKAQPKTYLVDFSRIGAPDLNPEIGIQMFRGLVACGEATEHLDADFRIQERYGGNSRRTRNGCQPSNTHCKSRGENEELPRGNSSFSPRDLQWVLLGWQPLRVRRELPPYLS